MIVVNYHDDLNEVQGDAALKALLAAPHARTPFDRIEWWQKLTECCASEPLIAVAARENVRAVLPLQRNGRRLDALGNWFNFTVAPLIGPGANASDMVTALAGDLAKHTSRVVFAPLPDENGETTLVADGFRKAGWLVFRERCDSNHVLRVAGRSYAEYLASRPGQVRTTLKRKANKVSIEIHTAFSEAIWADYEAVYAESWKPDERCPGFLRRFAEEESAAGRLRLAIARAEGRPVAAQFWTVEAGTAFIHKLAHVEDAKPLSPGTTLSAALFEHVIDRDRVELIDFGTGDDGYKRDWMEEVRPRYRLNMMRPGWPGNWPAIAKATVRRLAAGSDAG